jgi:hypothetical protein
MSAGMCDASIICRLAATNIASMSIGDNIGLSLNSFVLRAVAAHYAVTTPLVFLFLD